MASEGVINESSSVQILDPSTPASNPVKHIEFGLEFKNYNNLNVIVRDVLEKEEYTQREFNCEIFNPTECHHNNNKSNENEEKLMNQHKNVHKCSYCRFIELLNTSNSSIKTKSSLINKAAGFSANNKQHFININYKTGVYPAAILDWCQLEPTRAPFFLIGYAACYNQSDILNAIKKFETLKNTYRKTVMMSKLFINFHKVPSTNETLKEEVEVEVDSDELNERLKVNEKDICYIDYRFDMNEPETPATKERYSQSELKIQSTISDSINVIVDKLYDLATNIDEKNEKQKEYYYDHLKCPLDKETKNFEFSSMLSFKVVDKKIVLGRMVKYKGDLFLILNLFDSAIKNYNNALNYIKKNSDLIWACATVEALAVASYLSIKKDKKKDKSKSSSTSITTTTATATSTSNSSSKNSSDNDSILNIMNFLSSKKENSNQIIQLNELAGKFLYILNIYNNHEEMHFIAFELSLMMAKLYASNEIESNSSEILNFLSLNVYCNINLDEEFRVNSKIAIPFSNYKFIKNLKLIKRLNVTMK
jgi:tetratricopeptide (TPR) repeat protein